MKKIIIIMSLLLLVSCGTPQTHREKMEIKKQCTELGFETIIGINSKKVFCSSNRISDRNYDIMKCIKEYTNGLDEKYNNPDSVNNLREDSYSNVVKTCNDIFGPQNKGNTVHIVEQNGLKR